MISFRFLENWMNTPDMFRLDGRVALVTGAARGIGRAIAAGLAGAGADVVLTGRGAGLAEAAAAIGGATGRRIAFVAVDLSAAGSAGFLVAEAGRVLGPVDILVNNAGIIRRADLTEYSERDWDDVIGINLKAVFLLSQAFARGMIERGRGKIINIASVLSFQGGIRVPAYAASKGGLALLTKALANELAPRGVNVNAIAPGYIVTDNTEALRADEARNRQIIGRIPAGRWGEPADIAGTALFLAADASRYVHGHVLVVDGGWLAR
jgi:2-dehydro-3-deoxy-D-gluconate 5-dehydrogenase